MQDANVFVSESDPGMEHTFVLGQGRRAYLVNVEGTLAVNAVELAMRDAVALVAEQPMQISLCAGTAGSHFMLIELAA